MYDTSNGNKLLIMRYNNIFIIIVLSIILFIIVALEFYNSNEPVNCLSINQLPNPLLNPIARMDSIPPYFSIRNCADCPLGKPLDNNGQGVIPGGDWTRFHKILYDLSTRRKKKLTIAFLGGSMTTGIMIGPTRYFRKQHKKYDSTVDYSSKPYLYSNWYTRCNNTCTGTGLNPHDLGLNNPCVKCAFPARFDYWLKFAYPNVEIVTHNLAISATSSLVYTYVLH
jgi:hypothetical protein